MTSLSDQATPTAQTGNGSARRNGAQPADDKPKRGVEYWAAISPTGELAVSTGEIEALRHAVPTDRIVKTPYGASLPREFLKLAAELAGK